MIVSIRIYLVVLPPTPSHVLFQLHARIYLPGAYNSSSLMRAWLAAPQGGWNETLQEAR